MNITAVRVASFNEIKEPGQFVLDMLYPADNLRDLTPEELEQHAGQGYVKYQEYPPDDSAIIGKFWTQAELEAVANGPVATGITFLCPCGCGAIGGIRFNQFGRPGSAWTWDGNKDKPTCTPSIQRTEGCRWHGHLIDGVFVPC